MSRNDFDNRNNHFVSEDSRAKHQGTKMRCEKAQMIYVKVSESKTAIIYLNLNLSLLQRYVDAW